MGFHLSNLFCRFKRTVCLFVCLFVFSKFPESPQKQENLCDIEVYYSLNHDIGTLASVEPTSSSNA